jgi:8-oxo-dGTP pyrophosphatase MutT (NUDIX family)
VLQIGETPTQAAICETLEETGIDNDVLGVIGVYSNPAHVIAYDDGEVRQQFRICLAARPGWRTAPCPTVGGQEGCIGTDQRPGPLANPPSTTHPHQRRTHLGRTPPPTLTDE